MVNAKPTRRTKKKVRYMSRKSFADLVMALSDALAFERDGSRDLKTTRIRVPRKVKAMNHASETNVTT
jgi:hypothetical protein